MPCMSDFFKDRIHKHLYGTHISISLLSLSWDGTWGPPDVSVTAAFIIIANTGRKVLVRKEYFN